MAIFVGAGSVGAKEMSCATGVSYGSGLRGGNYRMKSNIFDNNFLISFSLLCCSARLILGGADETLGFGDAFLMAGGGSGAVATGVLAGIPAGPTVVAFGPADLWSGSWVGIS